MSKRDHYHHGNLREEIVRTARKVLVSEGIEPLTIRAVARELDVAHSAPANHFPTKRALMTALATQIFEELGDHIEAELKNTSHAPAAQLRAIVRAVIAYGLENPNPYRLIWRRDYLDGGDDNLNHAMDRIYELLIRTLEKASPACAQSVHSQAVALWSMTHGYVSMRLDGNLIAKDDEITGQPREEAIIDVILNGIRP